MRRLLPITLLVLVVATPAFAVSHRHAPKVKHRKAKRFNFKKAFPAGLESVLRENIEADKIQAWRYNDQDEMQEAINRGELVPLDGLFVQPKLPANRRYARPATVKFARQLSREFADEFGDTKHFVPLTVNSAVRPMDTQIKLRKKLGCRWHSCVAAPADGERASSHERGTTIDISRRVTKTQLHWLILRLMYYRAIHRILVIEERACFHIFVYNGGVEAALAIVEGVIDERIDREDLSGVTQPGSLSGTPSSDIFSGSNPSDSYPFFFPAP